MDTGVNWLEVVGLLLVVAGLWFTMFRMILSRIDKGDEENRLERSTQIAQVHSRINEVRENFVRRDDLNDHIQRIEKSIDRMYSEQRDHAGSMNRRIDDVLAAIANIGASKEKPGR